MTYFFGEKRANTTDRRKAARAMQAKAAARKIETALKASRERGIRNYISSVKARMLADKLFGSAV